MSGVIVSAPTVSSDIAATAAALSADVIADVSGAEMRRNASAMVSRFLRNAGAPLSFFGALLRWRRGVNWSALEQLRIASTATARRMYQNYDRCVRTRSSLLILADLRSF